MSEKRIVVVLGMHRSGTSAITKGLQLLGVGLGENLHPAAADNPKGFWEDKDCLEINEALLAHLGSAYDRLALAWADIQGDAVVSSLKLRAAQLLTRKLQESGGAWGFKDPRTCRLLAFWQDVFKTVDCRVGYVIALRNPASVADSLASRNDIPREKSYFLWMQHTLAAVLQTRGEMRVLVDYDRLLEDPCREVSKISHELGLSIPEDDSAAVAAFRDSFLDEGLRHAHYTPEQLGLDGCAPGIVVDFYKTLAEVGAGMSRLDSPDVERQLDNAFMALGRVAPIFNYVNLLEDVRVELWKKISECERTVARLSTSLVEQTDKAEQLNEGLAERNRQVVQLDCELAEQRTQIASLTALLGVRDQELGRVSHELRLVLSSKSWALTRPLRYLRRLPAGLRLASFSERGHELARAFWHWLPVEGRTKLRVKDDLFRLFPMLFRWSRSYSAWNAMRSDIEEVASDLVQTGRLGSPISREDYVPLLRADAATNLPVRLIAFYLPQFHAIKENDEWWGEGFTEWTNVKPAKPQFPGHYQPHIPGELGYYNLLDRDVQRRQIELAKLYGVAGFCFYYYWFGGKRLLEQPIENYLADSSLDHPFCLCWANENWSRRWDGLDSQMLIGQQHSPEDDLAIAADLARHMRDPRYIRIAGKPLLIVYRPSLLPSAFETSQRWRECFRENGIGEIYLAYTQSFETADPRKYGFDAAIEFPPNNSAPPDITDEVAAGNASFAGRVYDWSVFPERAQQYKPVPYRLFRSVCPSWDNTARRKNKGTIFLNSSPQAYRRWLESAVEETCRVIDSPDERLVFINAWNEWAEGAHLEPDQKYGYAWLEATRKALTGEPSGQHRERILVVSHDAHPHGAQFLALGMVRSLVQDLKLEVHTVLLGEGRLTERFAEYSQVHSLLPGRDFEQRAANLARQLVDAGFRRALVNTTVSGIFGKILAEHGVDCISLVHEMPGVIRDNELSEHAQAIAASSRRVVFPAAIVEQGFAEFAEVSEAQRVIRPQGLWRRNLLRFRKGRVRQEVRSRLGVAADAPLILAVGYADRRKGVDLFVQAALRVLESRPDAVFVWVGHWDERFRPQVEALLQGHAGSFRFLGYQPETASYHAAADIYALTSREDPFPNVVLESFDAGVPVVAFAETGGGAQLAARVGGRVVPAEDAQAFAGMLVELLERPDTARELGAQGSALVDREYALRSYLFDLCRYAGLSLPRVSVVVPNYNYARYIGQRLDSIIRQTLPIYELIILDDASTDDSVEVISRWLDDNKVECRLVVNENNSGSVFDQWARGVALASGDFIWIAEADDLSAPEFLETVIAPMERDATVNLSFCESRQIDEHGQCIADSYHGYRESLCAEHWRVPYVQQGRDEIVRYLAVKNTIPNVSGVLFRRERIAGVFAEHLEEIRALGKAGDWLAYIRVLDEGRIAFDPRPLNLHRRHAGSVIGGSHAQRLVEEIATVQARVASDYPLAAEMRQQAAEYIRQLQQQFNIRQRVSSQ